MWHRQEGELLEGALWADVLMQGSQILGGWGAGWLSPQSSPAYLCSFACLLFSTCFRAQSLCQCINDNAHFWFDDCHDPAVSTWRKDIWISKVVLYFLSRPEVLKSTGCHCLCREETTLLGMFPCILLSQQPSWLNFRNFWRDFGTKAEAVLRTAFSWNESASSSTAQYLHHKSKSILSPLTPCSNRKRNNLNTGVWSLSWIISLPFQGNKQQGRWWTGYRRGKRLNPSWLIPSQEFCF